MDHSQTGAVSLEVLAIAALFGAALALAVYGVPVREDLSTERYECIRAEQRTINGRPLDYCVEYRPRQTKQEPQP